jgi:WD40 repeat protein
MDASIYDGIGLAEGFRFTDHMTSPYRLRHRYNYRCGPKEYSSAITISNVDGTEREELLDQEEELRNCPRCLSPDGSTLYYHSEYLYAKDIATGKVRRLDGIPQEPPFDVFRLLQCSPDNRTLVFTQTTTRQMKRGMATTLPPYRLCRVSTDGTDWRVLYEDPPDNNLLQVICCWEQGFILFSRLRMTPEQFNVELWKMSLDSGELEPVHPPTDMEWNLVLSPDSRQVAWASREDGIFQYSLENGETRQLLPTGSCPSWSPDGKTIAFMQDQQRLCLLDIESGRTQNLAWFEPSDLSGKQCRGSYARAPIWSPDGRMILFALAQERKLPLPRSLSEIWQVGCRYLYPTLHNLNPKRTSYHVAYRHTYHLFRAGVLDLTAQEVLLWKGYYHVVDWLPRNA